MVAPTPDATPTGRCTTPVAKWSELVDRQPAAARVAETDLVVVRKDAEVVVLFGRCTHRGGLMAEGRVEEDTLVCAFHGWDYTLSTGVEPGKCVLAGVPWVCPPGFVGDPQHKDSVPGLPACVPDMADCLEGKWGGIKGPKVRYVDAAAQPGGVGTQTAPYNALAVAVAKSPPGATLAVAAGEYPGTVVITKPIRIVGRCAALVSVVAVVLASRRRSIRWIGSFVQAESPIINGG